MTINPAVLIALCVVAVTFITAVACVASIYIQTRANAQAEHEYRLYVQRQQQIEAARYAVMLAHEQRVIEVRNVTR